MTSTLSRRIAPAALFVTGLGSAAIALAPAALAVPGSATFGFTGHEETWLVPDGVTTVHVRAVGGQGGDSSTDPGGFGAALEADLNVIPGETLYVDVGSNGHDATELQNAGAGGYNGGGVGGFSGAGGGGGASDVRTVPAADGIGSLDSRLLVAGGGGGAGFGDPGGSCPNASTASLDGCAAPATSETGSDGYPGDGGTQSSGGTGGAGVEGNETSGSNGGLGVGGDGGSYNDGGGGGGAGYFGGGGGGSGVAAGDGGGGGAGSSFVGPRGQLTSFGNDNTAQPEIVITPLLPQPQSTTEPATSIGQTSATLNGVLDAEGWPADFYFEYGTQQGQYPGATQVTQAPADSVQHGVAATASGLSPGTTYYFKLVVQGDGGTAYGNEQHFTTAAATTGRTPTATTSPAVSVGWTKAQLNGVVNARGALTSYYFQWGTTTAYGQTTPPQNVGPAWGKHTVKAQLTGLTRHTTYHFRLVATNANGTVQGVDRTFHTG